MTARRGSAWRPVLAVGLVVAAIGLGGCASLPAGSPPPSAMGQNKADPWESFNRRMFAFNEVVDEAVLKPVAEAYRAALPPLVRQGVSNFFGNIGDVWSTANHFLQGKLQSGLEMGLRVASNTVFGLAGILDPATEFGLTRRSEDLGQTLAVWGAPSGPYLVLPLLGPSTLRDALALPADRWASTPGRFAGDLDHWLVTPLQVVQVRAELLDTTRLLGEASLDKYSFFRDGWLSRRLDQVYDGNPPLETFDDEPDAPTPAKK